MEQYVLFKSLSLQIPFHSMDSRQQYQEDLYYPTLFLHPQPHLQKIWEFKHRFYENREIVLMPLIKRLNIVYKKVNWKHLKGISFLNFDLLIFKSWAQ